LFFSIFGRIALVRRFLRGWRQEAVIQNGGKPLHSLYSSLDLSAT